MTFRFSGGGNALDDIAARMRRCGGQLRPRATEALRRPTREVYDKIRGDILHADMSARRVGGRPFRANLPKLPVRRPTAAALNWKVSTAAGGARAEVTFSASKIPPRIRPLFPYWVGQKKRLRHPIMGRRKGRWVGQKIPNVWGRSEDLREQAARDIHTAVRETADILTGRGR
jgi:hypothetical protein